MEPGLFLGQYEPESVSKRPKNLSQKPHFKTSFRVSLTQEWGRLVSVIRIISDSGVLRIGAESTQTRIRQGAGSVSRSEISFTEFHCLGIWTITAPAFNMWPSC